MPLGKKVWAQVAATCTGIVMIGAAVAAYDDIRLWPTKVEFQQVAGRSCKNEMSFFKQELRTIRREIEQAKADGNKNWERSLQDQERAVLAEIERVKRECGWS